MWKRPLDGLTLLVVDHNPNALTALDATLTAFGAVVLTARSGDEGLEQLARERVDVIISDISTPTFSSFEFLTAVRPVTGATQRRIPAIALVAVDGPAQRRRVLQGGFQAYFRKSVDLDELVQEIVRLAEGRGRVRAA